jgi:class 3 adenylate cyclase
MPQPRQPRTPESAQLDAVRDVLRAISNAPFDLTGVLGIACGHVVDLCDGDYGYVFVPDGEHLRLIGSARAPEAMLAYMREHPLPIDRSTVAGRVMMTGEADQIADVFADREWNFRAGQQLGGYRATMGVPLLKESRVIGVFAIGRMAAGRWTEQQVDVVRTFADQAAIMVDNVRLLGTVERQREELAQYLSPKVADMISSSEGAQKLAAHRSEISAVYCDLRGFTAFTVNSEPEEVIGVISEYQREMGTTVMTHNGTLEGYAGDGIMAFLNDPVPVPLHAREAVSMALDMQERFAALSASWSRRGWELGLGIGLSTGYATVGRVGFEGYYRYAAIGSVRLPSLARW